MLHPDELPDWARELFEERAAIMEYDGGLQRWKAERLALWWAAAMVERKEREEVDVYRS